MTRSITAAALGALLLASGASAQYTFAERAQAPEFQKVQEWINSKPLTLEKLRGEVVVLHFWTFG